MLTDNGFPTWLSTSICARLKQYPPAQRRDMIAMLVEARTTWERDIDRAAQRRAEATESEDEDNDEP